LAAGVPLYGYDFAYKKDKDPESGQTPPGYKVLRYKELVQQFPGASTAANANIKVSGNTPRPDFVSASGSYPYAHNLYLETPDTAVAKLNFLKKLGMQGVILWEMNPWTTSSLTKQTVGNFIEDDDLPNAVRFWKALTSDSKHIALFAYITFGGRGR
jgi:spore germination protein YaaH